MYIAFNYHKNLKEVKLIGNVLSRTGISTEVGKGGGGLGKDPSDGEGGGGMDIFWNCMSLFIFLYGHHCHGSHR